MKGETYSRCSNYLLPPAQQLKTVSLYRQGFMTTDLKLKKKKNSRHEKKEGKYVLELSLVTR